MNIQPLRRGGGFSLVELMVSVVIGLLALLFATRLIVSGEQNKDAAVGGSDSMQNGMLALFSLSSDATEAGWGLNDPMVAGCDTVFSDANGYALPTAQRGGANFTPLAAAVIQSNGANPDVISFNSGTSQAGAGSVKLFADYTVGNTITVDSKNPYAFSNGDVLVIAPLTPGSGKCTLFQLSGFGVAPNSTILVASGGAYRFNPLAGLATPYKQNLAYIYNLGSPTQLHFHTWSVANGVLLLRATELAGAELAGVSVTDNVVSIKAQYGFDARPPGPNPYDPNPGADGMQITTWSSTMIDADSDGIVGSPGDFQRVAAVRIAVVARSKNTEKPNSSGVCSATTVRPTVFASTAPAGVAAVPVQVNVAVAGDSVSWQCYRYRVFETIVPIRNAQWRP
ncbi:MULTISPECIES: PilW family protein [unclassified Duganella]|uniref:PilW family protein n=1 Tax=unclassified Duganella TaxID=2636909 RepID=UPI000E344198|nr:MULTISPECIES: PilW family protein [unclassified Duganella]RFP19033.1 pilus assembly protein PilW [Duganella sp. BJB475]RFP35695.1 pilus assembly protein PilW [Duganella sp. BJB476]